MARVSLNFRRFLSPLEDFWIWKILSRVSLRVLLTVGTIGTVLSWDAKDVPSLRVS